MTIKLPWFKVYTGVTCSCLQNMTLEERGLFFSILLEKHAGNLPLSVKELGRTCRKNVVKVSERLEKALRKFGIVYREVATKSEQSSNKVGTKLELSCNLVECFFEESSDFEETPEERQTRLNTERKRRQRERERHACHANVTNAEEEAEEETDKDTPLSPLKGEYDVAVAPVSAKASKCASKANKTLSAKKNTTKAVPEFSAGFISFWAIYPRKRRIAKSKCYDKWKLHKLESDSEKIIRHVRRMAATDDWQREDGRFVPQTLTYLNQKRWEDDDAEDLSSLQNGRQIGGVLSQEAVSAEQLEAQWLAHFAEYMKANEGDGAQ